MRSKLILIFILLSLSVFADVRQEVAFKLNPSIVKVHSANESGNHGVGSGVVIAKDHVVTNCHVIANSKGIHVTKHGVSYPPEYLIADWHHDVCILSFKFLELEAVTLGNTDSIKRGDEVIAKSFGSNAIRPITSTGRVKDIFNMQGQHIIQSSTWFSLGASGGGLFDKHGNLIGITTFKTPGKKALYYSLPVEIIKKLLTDGARTKMTEQAESPFWDEPPEKLPFFMQIVKPLLDQNWNELKEISTKWAQQKDSPEASYYLASSLYYLDNKNEAKTTLLKLLEALPDHAQGHRLLAKIYEDEGNKVKSDYHQKCYMELDSELEEFSTS
jgi:serine protease Do